MPIIAQSDAASVKSGKSGVSSGSSDAVDKKKDEQHKKEVMQKLLDSNYSMTTFSMR